MLGLNVLAHAWTRPAPLLTRTHMSARALQLPGGGSCRASFTTTAPVLALSAPPGFAILNPATTLAMAIISNHRSNLGAEAAQLMVATGLNLPAISRVFTHDIVSQIALG